MALQAGEQGLQALEFLPSGEEIEERRRTGRGLAFLRVNAGALLTLLLATLAIPAVRTFTCAPEIAFARSASSEVRSWP